MYHDIQNFKYFFPISEKKTFNKKWLLFPVENDEKDRKSAISNINFNRYVECNVNVKFPLKLTLTAHWSPAHDKPNIMFPKNTVPEKFPSKSVVLQGRIFPADSVSKISMWPCCSPDVCCLNCCNKFIRKVPVARNVLCHPLPSVLCPRLSWYKDIRSCKKP